MKKLSLTEKFSLDLQGVLPPELTILELDTKNRIVKISCNGFEAEKAYENDDIAIGVKDDYLIARVCDNKRHDGIYKILLYEKGVEGIVGERKKKQYQLGGYSKGRCRGGRASCGKCRIHKKYTNPKTVSDEAREYFLEKHRQAKKENFKKIIYELATSKFQGLQGFVVNDNRVEYDDITHYIRVCDFSSELTVEINGKFYNTVSFPVSTPNLEMVVRDFIWDQTLTHLIFQGLCIVNQDDIKWVHSLLNISKIRNKLYNIYNFEKLLTLKPKKPTPFDDL
jgi:hypothetical protein